MAITLEKKGDSHKIDLAKNAARQLTVKVNLNWSPKSHGFFSILKGNDTPDLDQR